MYDPFAKPKLSAEVVDFISREHEDEFDDAVAHAIRTANELPPDALPVAGREPFALAVPRSWIAACAKAHPQGLLLAMAIRAGTKGRRDEMVLSREAWEPYGLAHRTMRRALVALEAANIVTVRRPPGCAPRVRLLPWSGLGWGRRR